MNFYNKITSIRLAQGYSDVAAPGAGGSDPAESPGKSTHFLPRVDLSLVLQCSNPGWIIEMAMRVAQKVFLVLPLIFITDCSPIDWLQSVLKIRSFENVFISFLNFFQASRFLGGWII